MITHQHSHIHHANHTDFIEKKPINLEYIQALEEERRKIQVFERELPLCLQLVTQAIEECKKKIVLGKEGDYNFRGQSECSEQTSSEGPILEEFIPLKRNSSSDDDEQHSRNSENIEKIAASKKSDWLRSVQLWNQTPDPPPTKKDSPKTVSVVEVNKNGSGGAFHPFRREKKTDVPLQPSLTENRPPAPAAAASSTAETGSTSGGKSKKEEKERQSQRKIRRSWSPELHKRFLQALQQLGGSNVATPKQIRELMKVDGLTNDEVKSHLQKYRLHNRRPNTSTQNQHPQQPQFVVVGGIWMPPPEYTTAMASSEEAAGGDTCNGIYAPIATLATVPFQDASASTEHRYQKLPSGGGGIDSHHNSPASSSSTDTTTTSPPPEY